MVGTCERDGCCNLIRGTSRKRMCSKACKHAAYYAANHEKEKARLAAFHAANPEKKKAYSAAYYAANREKEKARNAAWRAANPEKHKARKAAYRAANPEKEKAYSAAYRAANPEKEKARHAAYHAANPEKSRAAKRRRRARKACAVPQRWVRRADHDDTLCYWCGSVDVEHVDHVHPISLGGPAVPSNEVPSCAPCNLSKSGKHPLVWLAELMEQT